MSKPAWSKAGEAPTYPSPMMGEYSTGDGAGEGSVLALDNATMASVVTGAEPRRTAFHRGAMGAAEAMGARLSVSPSAKIPQNDPASGYLQANTRFVKSRVGRSVSTFGQGMNESL